MPQSGRINKQAKAFITLILGGLVLGWSPILVRLSPLGPITTAFWRVGLACMPLLAIFNYRVRDGSVGRIPERLNEHVIAALPGVFLAADLASWQISLHMTSVANSTLLANMVPIFATLGGWLFWRQSVSRVFLFGLAVSIAGVLVLRGGPAAAGGGSIRGDALALVAAVFYAGYILFVSRARQVFSTAVIMLWSAASAAACILPLALTFETALLPSTAAGVGVLLALGWIVHAGGQSLIAFSLAWLPPSFSSLTLLIQPIVAAVLAWVLLHEPLGSWQIAGGVIIITGILLAKRS